LVTKHTFSKEREYKIESYPDTTESAVDTQIVDAP
jgi:hypothetical protein